MQFLYHYVLKRGLHVNVPRKVTEHRNNCAFERIHLRNTCCKLGASSYQATTADSFTPLRETIMISDFSLANFAAETIRCNFHQHLGLETWIQNGN